VPTKTSSGTESLHHQYRKARSEVGLRLYHICQPGMAWLAVTVVGLVLYAAPVLDRWRWLSALLVVAGGGAVALFDFHLRSHRDSVAGRLIGPVTAALATVVTVVFLATGFSVPLVLVYLLGGLVVWVMWAGWLVAGDPRDLARTFTQNAPAAGVGGAVLRMTGRARSPRRQRAGRPAARTAQMLLPADPAMTAEEVASHIGHIENVTRSKPGSWSLTSSPQDGGVASVVITDPEVLTRAPVDWPGPSAPGADMSVPFRLGYWQDGTEFLNPMLPLHHKRIMGRTRTAKTTGAAWTCIAEGVTRESYAAVVFDGGKGSQFFGAIEPALHVFAKTEDEIIALFAGLRRARLARNEYLAKDHFTAWTPDCRLSFLDIWLEEAQTALKYLNPSRTRRDPLRMSVAEWEEEVANGRTAGEAWTAVYQMAIKDQTHSSVARAQMGPVCLGVDSRDDAKFGLSDAQMARGAQPWLWKSKFPGLAVWDTDTTPDDRITVPMRFFNWPGGTQQVGAYMSEWSADTRPLDDITAEALAWTAPVSPSSGFPGPRAHGENVREADFRKRRSHVRQDEADGEIMAIIRSWERQGWKSFRIDDFRGLMGRVDRTRAWLYTAMSRLELAGVISLCAKESPQRWAILPEAQDDEAEEDPA
jgi:hypothetical protein